jgi:hypothetical protein
MKIPWSSISLPFKRAACSPNFLHLQMRPQVAVHPQMALSALELYIAGRPPSKAARGAEDDC